MNGEPFFTLENFIIWIITSVVIYFGFGFRYHLMKMGKDARLARTRYLNAFKRKSSE